MEKVNFEEFIKNGFVIVMFVAGVITTVGGAIAIIKKWWNETRLNKNSEMLKRHEEQIKNIDRKLKELEDKNIWQNNYIGVMCEAMLAILDHNINGNSIDKLKRAKDEMKDFLIKKNMKE